MYSISPRGGVRASIALVHASFVLALGCGPGWSDPGPGDGGVDGHDARAPAPRMLSEVEPNDGPEVSGMQDLGAITAGQTVLSGGLASGGNDGVRYTGDYDLFLFALAAVGDLTIAIEWTGSADVDAVVYDEAGATRAQDGTTARPIALRFAGAPGVYGLQLYSADLPADWTATFTFVPGTTAPGGSCVSPIPEGFSGGCTLAQNEPANGQQITLPFKFGWSASGCETPFRLFIYGNPPTEDNALYWEISRNAGGPTTEWAGSHTITAADLAPLRSDGLYHWAVAGFYGSHTAGRTFTLAPASCR